MRKPKFFTKVAEKRRLVVHFDKNFVDRIDAIQAQAREHKLDFDLSAALKPTIVKFVDEVEAELESHTANGEHRP